MTAIHKCLKLLSKEGSDFATNLSNPGPEIPTLNASISSVLSYTCVWHVKMSSVMKGQLLLPSHRKKTRLMARMMKYEMIFLVAWCGWGVMEQWEEREHIQTTWIPWGLHPKSRVTLALHDTDVERGERGEKDEQRKWCQRQERYISQSSHHCEHSLAEILTATLQCLTSTACLCSEWHHDRVSALEVCTSPACVSSCYLCLRVCRAGKWKWHVTPSAKSHSLILHQSDLKRRRSAKQGGWQQTKTWLLYHAGERFVMAARLSRWGRQKGSSFMNPSMACRHNAVTHDSCNTHKWESHKKKQLAEDEHWYDVWCEK